MLLCDDIIFWHEHRQRPLATEFDIAYITAIVDAQAKIREVLTAIFKESVSIAIKKVFRELKKNPVIQE